MRLDFVIEFDEAHSFFNQKRSENDDFRYLRKVKYSQQRPNVVMADVESFEMYLTKSKEWEYEQEWRMPLPLENCSIKKGDEPNLIHLFSFPFSAIKSLILGCRMELEIKNNIQELVSQNSELSHIEIFQSKLDEKEFSLHFEKIK